MCSWRIVFSIFFASWLPPTMMPFWLILQKVPKIQKCRSYETWAVAATLGRKNRTCHVTGPSGLTWRTHLFLTVSCVRRGGGRGPLTWQPLAQNLNVYFNLWKKVIMFLELIANLAGNVNNIETYCVNRDCVEGPVMPAVGGGEKGYTNSRPGLMWPELPGSMWPEVVRWRG